MLVHRKVHRKVHSCEECLIGFDKQKSRPLFGRLFVMKRLRFLNLYSNLLLLINRLSAVADVGDCADDEESGEAIESKNFAGDEDGGPKRVACAGEYGGKAEGCGEGDGHSEHACDEDSEGCADSKKRGDDTAYESGGERKDCECKFQNPVISGDVPNQVGGSGGTPRSIPGGSSYNIRGIPNQVCIPGDPKTQIQ